MAHPEAADALAIPGEGALPFEPPDVDRETPVRSRTLRPGEHRGRTEGQVRTGREYRVVSDPDEFVHVASSIPSTQMHDHVNRIGNLLPDGLIRQVDAAVERTGGEPRQRLPGRVGVDRR